ncbi:MAG: hypothetical protein ACRDRO_21345 [Pseudonocardiaceae bacterium]
MIDPQDADLSKVTASLVRDARSLLRRADKLASAVTAADDTTATLAAAAARDAVEQLVHQLIGLQQGKQRRARDAIRRGG